MTPKISGTSWWSLIPTRADSSKSGSRSLTVGVGVVVVGVKAVRGGNLVLEGNLSSSTVTVSLEEPLELVRDRPLMEGSLEGVLEGVLED